MLRRAFAVAALALVLAGVASAAPKPPKPKRLPTLAALVGAYGLPVHVDTLKDKYGRVFRCFRFDARDGFFIVCAYIGSTAPKSHAAKPKPAPAAPGA